MGRRNVTIILAVGLISLLLGLALPSYANGRKPVGLQTVPTRTPTPGLQPSKTPGGGEDGSAGPTSTPIGSRATTAPTATTEFVLRTPVGGYLPTAEPCGVPPTVRAVGRVNVREGPGLGYRSAGTLLLNEVRPIVGRSGDIAWWLIELPDGAQGWVANRVVVVSGYTGLVPIVQAPPLGSATPTRGPTWRPTVDPKCTPPAETATGLQLRGSATPTRTPAHTVTPRASATPTASQTPTRQISEATPSQANIDTTPGANGDSSAERPLDSGGSIWLLVGGVGLIIAGGIFLILRRRP